MNAPSATDFLLGSSGAGKSARFPQVGATVTGTITQTPEVRAQIDPDTGREETWDNGETKWQIVVALQTDERRPELEDDDGVRFVYIKGSKKPESMSLHAAVAGAVRTAGAPGLEIGGKLTVTYTGDGVKPSPTKNAPKQYSATYVAAAQNALLGAPEQAPVAAPAPVAPPAPPAATPPAPAPAPVIDLPYPPHLTPEQLAGVKAANVSPAIAWQMFPPPAA